MFAKIIVVEGPDRVGKATQVNLLSKKISNKGLRTKIVEVPVRSALTYPIIYGMLKTGLVKKFPTTFQVIQSLNKLFFQFTILFFYLFRYDYLIFDRWSVSSLVYGNSSGANRLVTDVFYRLMKRVDAVVVINGEPRNLEARDYYEADRNFQKLISNSYSEWVKENSELAREVSSAGSREEVHKRVLNSLYDLGICDIK